MGSLFFRLKTLYLHDCLNYFLPRNSLWDDVSLTVVCDRPPTSLLKP